MEAVASRRAPNTAMRGVESPGGLAGMVAQNAFRTPTGIDEANWEVGCAPKCPQGGCRGAPTRQHGAPCTVVGGWLPASRGGEQAPALLHLHRTVAGRRTGAQAAAMARRHMQERHAPKAVGQSRAVAAQVAAQGRAAAAAAAQAACCQAAYRLTTRSSSAASGGLEAHQPSAAAAGQPRHLPHSLLGGLQILGQRRQLPLAGLPSDDLHASKASGGNQSSTLFRPRKAPT